MPPLGARVADALELDSLAIDDTELAAGRQGDATRVDIDRMRAVVRVSAPWATDDTPFGRCALRAMTLPSKSRTSALDPRRSEMRKRVFSSGRSGPGVRLGEHPSQPVVVITRPTTRTLRR